MFDINYIAVLVAAIAAFIVGMLWYSPVLFGSQWQKLMGFSEEELKKMKEKSMAPSMIIMMLSQLVMAFVLAHIIDVFGAFELTPALEVGFWLWLGFMATKNLGVVLWLGKSWNLYFLNAMYDLVTLLVMAAILGPWQ